MDWITDKVYMANVSPHSNTINVVDIHTSYKMEVLDLIDHTPSDLVVDIGNRYYIIIIFCWLIVYTCFPLTMS